MKRKTKHSQCGSPMALSFSIMDELMADPVAPVSGERMSRHLMRVYQGLESLAKDATPSLDSWRDIVDAVNIIASLAETGYVSDQAGQIVSAKNAMGEAGSRHMQTGVLRLSGEGMQVIRAVLADYVEVVRSISERQFVRACRHAEKRIRQIIQGQRAKGDVVVSL